MWDYNKADASNIRKALDSVNWERLFSGYNITDQVAAFNEVLLNMTVCSCHVTYAFESESTLYSCLNVKELLARSRREI